MTHQKRTKKQSTWLWLVDTSQFAALGLKLHRQWQRGQKTSVEMKKWNCVLLSDPQKGPCLCLSYKISWYFLGPLEKRYKAKLQHTKFILQFDFFRTAPLTLCHNFNCLKSLFGMCFQLCRLMMLLGTWNTFRRGQQEEACFVGAEPTPGIDKEGEPFVTSQREIFLLKLVTQNVVFFLFEIDRQESRRCSTLILFPSVSQSKNGHLSFCLVF